MSQVFSPFEVKPLSSLYGPGGSGASGVPQVPMGAGPAAATATGPRHRKAFSDTSFLCSGFVLEELAMQQQQPSYLQQPFGSSAAISSTSGGTMTMAQLAISSTSGGTTTRRPSPQCPSVDEASCVDRMDMDRAVSLRIDHGCAANQTHGDHPFGQASPSDVWAAPGGGPYAGYPGGSDAAGTASGSDLAATILGAADLNGYEDGSRAPQEAAAQRDGSRSQHQLQGLAFTAFAGGALPGCAARATSSGGGAVEGRRTSHGDLPSRASGEGASFTAAGAKPGTRGSKGGGQDASAGRGKREGSSREKSTKTSNGRSERELVLLDPKRVRRIIANRQSAAKSKERKQHYTGQLEQMLAVALQEQQEAACRGERVAQGSAHLARYSQQLAGEAAELQSHVSAMLARNQALLHELYGLRRAAGLEGLRPPQPDVNAAMAAAAGAVPDVPDLALLGLADPDEVAYLTRLQALAAAPVLLPVRDEAPDDADNDAQQQELEPEQLQAAGQLGQALEQQHAAAAKHHQRSQAHHHNPAGMALGPHAGGPAAGTRAGPAHGLLQHHQQQQQLGQQLAGGGSTSIKVEAQPSGLPKQLGGGHRPTQSADAGLFSHMHMPARAGDASLLGLRSILGGGGSILGGVSAGGSILGSGSSSFFGSSSAAQGACAVAGGGVGAAASPRSSGSGGGAAKRGADAIDGQTQFVARGGAGPARPPFMAEPGLLGGGVPLSFTGRQVTTAAPPADAAWRMALLGAPGQGQLR